MEFSVPKVASIRIAMTQEMDGIRRFHIFLIRQQIN